MSIKIQNRQSRMMKEAKAIQKKAARQGGQLRGSDKARLRAISGRLVKTSYLNEEDEVQ